MGVMRGRTKPRDDGPLFHVPRIASSEKVVEALRSKRMLPDRVVPCGDLELVKSLALEGVGVALLPRRVAAYGQKGKLVRLHPELPFIPDVISLLYRADLHRTRAALRLKDALVAHGRALEATERTGDTGLATAAEPLYR